MDLRLLSPGPKRWPVRYLRIVDVPVARLNDQLRRSPISVICGEKRAEESDGLDDIAIEDRQRSAIINIAHGVERRNHQHTVHVEPDGTEARPRAEKSAVKSSPVVTPGSACTERNGSSIKTLVRFFNSASFRV